MAAAIAPPMLVALLYDAGQEGFYYAVKGDVSVGESNPRPQGSKTGRRFARRSREAHACESTARQSTFKPAWIRLPRVTQGVFLLSFLLTTQRVPPASGQLVIKVVSPS